MQKHQKGGECIISGYPARLSTSYIYHEKKYLDHILSKHMIPIPNRKQLQAQWFAPYYDSHELVTSLQNMYHTLSFVAKFSYFLSFL